MTWHVWCDGSCQHGVPEAPRGVGGWGGWCAIVEHGSDGRVLRGRVPDTTNVRMELLAAIEGLGAGAVLHTDCTTLAVVHERWRRDELDHRDGRRAGPDVQLWRQLGAEFGRVGVVLHLVVKGESDPIHRRCDKIAGTEARGGLRNLPANHTPLDGDDHRILAKQFRRQVREWRDRQSRVTAAPLPTPVVLPRPDSSR